MVGGGDVGVLPEDVIETAKTNPGKCQDCMRRDVMGVSNGDVAVLARVIEIGHKGMRVVEPRRVRVVRDGGQDQSWKLSRLHGEGCDGGFQ